MLSLVCIVADVLVQSAVILGVGLALDFACRKRGAWVRSVVGRATLAAVALVIAGRCVAPGPSRALWSIRLMDGMHDGASLNGAGLAPASPVTVSTVTAAGRGGHITGLESNALPLASRQFGSMALSQAAELRLPMARLMQIVLLSWMVVTCLILARLLHGYARLHTLRRRAVRVEADEVATLVRDLAAAMGLRRPLVLTSAEISSPFVTGVVRPTLILPTAFAGEFSPAAQRAVVIHELTHLARHDLVWHLAGRLLCAVLWPQPLLWLWCHRLHEISEEACDDGVLAWGCCAHDYATCLLDLAERMTGRTPLRWASAGAAPARSSLSRRLEHVLQESTRHQVTASRAMYAAWILSVVMAAIAAHHLVAVGGAPHAASDHAAVDVAREHDGVVHGTGHMDFDAAGPIKGQRSLPPIPAGVSDTQVQTLQYLLRAHGYDIAVDGQYGVQTLRGLTHFQVSQHLPVRAEAGVATWAALLLAVRRGDRGDEVRAVQDLLKKTNHERLRLRLPIIVDGDFGAQTDRAVRQYQKQHHLHIDGVVARETWSSLLAAV